MLEIMIAVSQGIKSGVHTAIDTNRVTILHTTLAMKFCHYLHQIQSHNN